MPATATVTGKTGAGNTITAGVFTGVTGVVFDCVKNILSLTLDTGRVVDIDINAAATITATKVTLTNTYTFTVS